MFISKNKKARIALTLKTGINRLNHIKTNREKSFEKVGKLISKYDGSAFKALKNLSNAQGKRGIDDVLKAHFAAIYSHALRIQKTVKSIPLTLSKRLNDFLETTLKDSCQIGWLKSRYKAIEEAIKEAGTFSKFSKRIRSVKKDLKREMNKLDFDLLTKFGLGQEEAKVFNTEVWGAFNRMNGSLKALNHSLGSFTNSGSAKITKAMEVVKDIINQ